MNIVTLTLSPAFDRYCRAEGLKPGSENLARQVCFSAGGKGINISRALHAAGIPSKAVVILGRQNGTAFADEVKGQGIDFVPLWQEGRIRENITVATPAGETRISFSAAPIDRKMLERVFKESHLAAGDILTLTGRLPEGVSVADVMPFLTELKCKGVLLVIDSKSFALSDLIALAPWLIKPNEEEIAAYLGENITTLADALAAAASLHQKGIENVMISLGDKGAVLVNAEGAFSCAAPAVSVRSTVGAGDSSIAGFITAYFRGLPVAEKLRHAVAFGSAACLSDGPLRPTSAAAHRIAKQLMVEKV